MPGVWGQQQGGPDLCPLAATSSSAHLARGDRPGNACCRGLSKDFPSSTQQSIFFSAQGTPQAPHPLVWSWEASRAMHARPEAARGPQVRAGRTRSHGRGADRGWAPRPDPGPWPPHGRPRLPLSQAPAARSRGVSVQWCRLPSTPPPPPAAGWAACTSHEG